MNNLLKIEHLTRVYAQGGTDLHVLKDVSFDINEGEIVALVGPSGAGKSTLLQLAGLLDKPSGGTIHICGADASALNERKRTLLRRDTLGFVYQFHYLQQEFTALENVAMPLIISGWKEDHAHHRAARLLDEMGLSHRVDHRPARLSGGEQQRTAIARALAKKPKILLADEPTGNLDPETADKVFRQLMDLTRRAGAGALIATHNMELAAKMDRTLTLKDGVVG